MDELKTCLNFFDECLTFKEKYERFERVCMSLDPDNFDDESLKEAAEYYVLVKHELSELCHLECHKYEQNEEDSDDDDMDTSLSEASDDSDDSDDSDEDSMSTDGEGEEGEEDDEEEEEEDDEEEDSTILLRTNQCCFDKILAPFFDAMEGNKLALSTIQREEDKKEEQCKRLEEWFTPTEKCLTAKLLQEICEGFHEKQHKFFRLCSSVHIKLLASYCKNIVKANTLEEMFGGNYKLLIDEKVPLNKKRKIFKDKENIDKLITYLKENTLPQVHQFIQAKQQEILEKCTKDE